MFTDDDFRGYLDEISEQFKRTLVIYTDLLNEVQDQSVKNKLLSLMTENAEAFRFFRDQGILFSSASKEKT